MSVFAPEFRENRESMFEARKLSKNIEQEVQRALQQKKERFPDIVSCPIRSCGTPVRIEMRGDEAVLVCPNCGWQTTIHDAG
ncbi:hypothetical protein EPO34_03115 [Patescibacteria group bacterium]|nr:MAG: hypothetical protein EPO34_03115 [Patescibacteria group bacterium]